MKFSSVFSSGRSLRRSFRIQHRTRGIRTKKTTFSDIRRHARHRAHARIPYLDLDLAQKKKIAAAAAATAAYTIESPIHAPQRAPFYTARRAVSGDI